MEFGKIIKSFTFESTNIYVCRKYHKPKKVEDLILELIMVFIKKQEKQVRRFLNFYFILEDETTSDSVARGSAAYVLLSEITSTMCPLHIGLGEITLEPNLSKRKWIGRFAHEVTHAVHKVINPRYDKIRAVAEERYQELLRPLKNSVSVEEGTKYRWIHLRRAYVLFLDGIFAEGLAEFARKEPKWDEALLVKWHSKAKAKAHKLVKKILKYYSESYNLASRGFEIPPPTFLWKMRKYMYKIGLHMVYTILYSGRGKIKLENIMQLGIHRFIKLYETSCIKEGLRPVVSDRGGRGFFDYKKQLVLLNDFAEGLKEVYASAK